MSATTKIKSFSALLSLLPSLFGTPHAPHPPIVTILCYHTFGSSGETDFNLDPRRFDEQMRFLYVQRIPVIPLKEYLDYRQKGTPLPPRAVVITIDDGYRTARDIAWPILKKYGFSFTLYVYPHSISRIPTALRWDDLKEMSAAGVDVQSHTFTHPLLTHPAHAMNKEDYLRWLDSELVESKRRIETHLGTVVTSVAYPYGGYDEGVVERVRAAGYAMGLSCVDEDASAKSDLYALGRKLVFRRTSARTFARFFQSLPLEVKPVSPRAGERVNVPVQEITAEILNLKDVRPETLKIRVDKVGGRWTAAKVDPQTGKLAFRFPKPPRPGYCVVKVSGTDKHETRFSREASWQFIISRNASIK